MTLVVAPPNLKVSHYNITTMPADQANPIRRTVERPPGALGLLEPLIERNRRDIEELIDQDDALRDRNERCRASAFSLCKTEAGR